MRSTGVQRRMSRLEEQRALRETERCLWCLADDMELDPELLRSEAMALVERFAEAGVTVFVEKLALVAEELALPIEELRREVEQAMACCR